MPYIKLNDLNMFYEEFGKGETVLFLHSHFSRGLLAFSGQILPFAGHYRCLYPDFRGSVFIISLFVVFIAGNTDERACYQL